MSYVNFNDDTVDLNKHQPKKKARKDFAPTHGGWIVKGASPDEYAKHVLKRKQLIESIQRNNKNPRALKMVVPDEFPPFGEWAKKNKTKASAKPYSSFEVALESRKLAERAGWTNLEIIELKKGDVSQIKEGFIWR